MAIRSRLVATVGVKGAVGIAAALLAVGGGSVAAMATTGSANPENWGHQVVQAVEACKATAAAEDTNGIGRCVSAFAKKHGEAQQDSKGNDRDNDNDSDDNNQGDNDNSDNNNDKDDQKATPSPAPSGSVHGQSDQSHGSNDGQGQNDQTRSQTGTSHGRGQDTNPKASSGGN